MNLQIDTNRFRTISNTLFLNLLWIFQELRFLARCFLLGEPSEHGKEANRQPINEKPRRLSQKGKFFFTYISIIQIRIIFSINLTFFNFIGTFCSWFRIPYNFVSLCTPGYHEWLAFEIRTTYWYGGAKVCFEIHWFQYFNISIKKLLLSSLNDW